MAEWVFENLVAEWRGMLVEDDEVIAARLAFEDELYAGMRVTARLKHKSAGRKRGTAVDEKSREILIDQIPAGVCEGQEVIIEITRAAIPETGRTKLAQGKIVTTRDSREKPGSSFLTAVPTFRFRDELWADILLSAATGTVDFDGGSLHFSPTPAMTLIDIDGDLPPRQLALAAIPVIARWLRLFDIGGSIGIDFPTLVEKTDRKAVDAALEEALGDWPHEKTAMNGFGFVQIVTRLEGPSLLQRFATSRAKMCGWMVMFQAVRIEEPGTILLTVHPSVAEAIAGKPQSLLAFETGRKVRIATDPSLAMEGGFAQAVPR